MTHLYEKVVQFHRAFNLPVREKMSEHTVPLDDLVLRRLLLLEEAEEWKAARTHVDALDALCDIVYIALGSVAQLGLATEVIYHPRRLRPAEILLGVYNTALNTCYQLSRRPPCVAGCAQGLFNVLVVCEKSAAGTGYDLDDAFSAVHEANMAKLWTPAETKQVPPGWTRTLAGSPLPTTDKLWIIKDETGKVRKPPSWVAPNLRPFVPAALIAPAG